MNVRLATIGKPVIPETEFVAFGHVRLDLRILAFLPALRLQRIGRKVRPHPRDEGDPSSIGEPFGRGAPGCNVSESLRFTAVRRDQIELGLVVVLALRRERDPFAVGRPLGIAVLVACCQQTRTIGAPRCSKPRRKQPERGAAFVLLHVEARDGAAGPCAIGRQRRRTDASYRPECFDCKRRLALRRAAGRVAGGAGHRGVLVQWRFAILQGDLRSAARRGQETRAGHSRRTKD